jgi:PilZ domain
MRRLVSGQAVTLDLDGSEQVLDCQVRSVAGPVALLGCVRALPPKIRPKLNPGSPCMMVFTHQGTLVGLKGIATTASDDLTELAFVVSDRVQVEERRTAERVALVTRAAVSEVSSDGTPGTSTETFTADLSLGGALIGRRPGLGPGPRFRLELFFAGDHAPLCCAAQLARQTPTHLGLKFTDIDPRDQVRLGRILAERQLRSAPSD